MPWATYSREHHFFPSSTCNPVRICTLLFSLPETAEGSDAAKLDTSCSILFFQSSCVPAAKHVSVLPNTGVLPRYPTAASCRATGSPVSAQVQGSPCDPLRPPALCSGTPRLSTGCVSNTSPWRSECFQCPTSPDTDQTTMHQGGKKETQNN